MMNSLTKTTVLCVWWAVSLPAGATVIDERFMPDGMNYVIGQWTENDQWALEANYSLKYVLYDCELSTTGLMAGCDLTSRVRFNVYLKYVGVFDFYAYTRESSPLLHRSSNPSAHMRWEYDGEAHLHWIDVGVEHRSTGQVTNANAKDTNPSSPTYGHYLTEIEFQRGNTRYFESLSRGANYLSLSLGGGFGNEWQYGMTGKLYEKDHERSNITWGPLAGEGRTFADYDLVRLDLSKGFAIHSRYMPKVILGVEYTVGKLGKKTDSANLNLILPFTSQGGWEFPLLIRGHLGPMERLSDYTRSRKSIGVGAALSY